MDYIYLRTYSNWITLMESSISLSSVGLFDERDKHTLFISPPTSVSCAI
jgi:hypothetical protein